MDEKPAKPDSASPLDPKPLKAVPWYKYKYTLWDWIVFAFFVVLISLLVKACTG